MASSILAPDLAAKIGHWFARKGKKIARKGLKRAANSSTHFVTSQAAKLLQKAAHKGTKGVLDHILPVPERTSISREEARENRLLPVRPFQPRGSYGLGYHSRRDGRRRDYYHHDGREGYREFIDDIPRPRPHPKKRAKRHRQN